MISFHFVLHLQEKLYDIHAFVICFKKRVYFKSITKVSIQKWSQDSFRAYLTVFSKYFMKLSNNCKYKLKHCINIKDCWGGKVVYTCFETSVYIYENIYDGCVWVYGHINRCPSLLIGLRKLLINS